jgi:hypothetical protein
MGQGSVCIGLAEPAYSRTHGLAHRPSSHFKHLQHQLPYNEQQNATLETEMADMKPSPMPHRGTKTKVNTGSVGSSKKANMSGAQDGFPSGGLSRAIGELKSQNHEMGHLRHEPLAGMKPRGGNSNG